MLKEISICLKRCFHIERIWQMFTFSYVCMIFCQILSMVKHLSLPFLLSLSISLSLSLNLSLSRSHILSPTHSHTYTDANTHSLPHLSLSLYIYIYIYIIILIGKKGRFKLQIEYGLWLKSTQASNDRYIIVKLIIKQKNNFKSCFRKCDWIWYVRLYLIGCPICIALCHI